jgi:hypothetical protein
MTSGRAATVLEVKASTGATSSDDTDSLVLTIIRTIYSLPIIIVAPVITRFINVNKFILNHFIFIPLRLLFLITIYIPFIKVPVVLPIKFILELNDDFTSRGIPWFQSQIELFFINIIHFFMVNVFLGIFVGAVAGMNLKVIRYFLTWETDPNHKPLNNKPASSNLYPMSTTSSGSHIVYPNANIDHMDDVSPKLPRSPAKPVETPKPLSFLDSVVVAASEMEPSTTLEALGISELPSTDRAKSISTSIKQHLTHNIRDRTNKLSRSESSDVFMYEDDDGYNYSYEEPRSEDNESTETPNKALGPPRSRSRSPKTSPLSQLSNIVEEEEPTSKEESSNSTNLFTEAPSNSDTVKTSVSAIKE